MRARRLGLCLGLCFLLLSACQLHRRVEPEPPAAPVAAAATPEAPPSAPASAAERLAKLRFDPAAPPDQLSLAMNWLEWVVSGEDAAWQRIEERVEMAAAGMGGALVVPVEVSPADLEEAGRFHAQGAELSRRPREAREPEREASVYTLALLANPRDADLYNHLAIAASLEKRYTRAERFAKLAIAIDPSFLSGYQELAYAYKNQARYAEAIQVADRGLELDGDLHTKALLLARKGQALWMQRERELALGTFAASKRLGGPSWIDSYLNGEQQLGVEFQPPEAVTKP